MREHKRKYAGSAGKTLPRQQHQHQLRAAAAAEAARAELKKRCMLLGRARKYAKVAQNVRPGNGEKQREAGRERGREKEGGRGEYTRERGALSAVVALDCNDVSIRQWRKANENAETATATATATESRQRHNKNC